MADASSPTVHLLICRCGVDVSQSVAQATTQKAGDVVMLITFSGVDGSGKSTQVELAMSWLQARGYQPRTLHLTQWTWVYQIGEKFGKKSENKGESNAAPPPFPIRLLRQIVSMFDIVRFTFLKWRLTEQDILICDRYFYDLGISAIYRRTMSLAFVTFMWQIAPRPDLAFFLNAHPQQAKEREHGDEHSADYYSDKLALYQKYTDNWPVVVLPSDELRATQSQISAALTALMERVG